MMYPRAASLRDSFVTRMLSETNYVAALGPASIADSALLVAHTGFEPVISSLRGRCPKPLDECAVSPFYILTQLLKFINAGWPLMMKAKANYQPGIGLYTQRLLSAITFSNEVFCSPE